MPAKFFTDKGFSPEILDKYDIGLCTNPSKEMYNRVVVPIYDREHKYMVACTGRSIEPECKKCGLYHNTNISCPKNDLRKYAKWRNNEKGNINNYLYNYWFSKKSIEDDAYAILVEGPADVWKLEELGIKNSLAIFGNTISDEQEVILETSGALSVIILLDMDEAGRKGVEMVSKKIKNSYKLFVPNMSVNDPGDYNLEIVEKELKPWIRKSGGKI